ncbi:MAG TPA: DUF4388 domain-containing protein [Thermoanaerobaculia bacterium]|nr:DUF4388 domain-containing protein [Thermoanaerobaculia bacterium]
MSVSGHLRTMAAGHLFQWLSFSQKTGRLVVRNTSVEKTIFVQKGKVVSSASTDPREYLGQFLMSYGYISEDELKKAMEVQLQSKILLGKILVIIEAITEDDLKRLMKRKAEEEIYDVFLWPDGEFEFHDDEKPAMELVPLNLDVTGVVMEGSRRVDEWDRARKVVTSTALVPSRKGKLDLSKLNEAQKRIVELVDGERTIEGIVLESRSSTFVVSRTISELVSAGKMKLGEKAAAAAPEPAAAPAELSADDSEIESLLARAQGGLKEGEFEKALRLLKAAQNLDPESAKVRTALKGGESVILSELKRQGISDHRVPHLRRPLEELSGMNFTPNEGFILSRINAQWDVASITKISPMREIDALLIFHKLVREQIVDLK